MFSMESAQFNKVPAWSHAKQSAVNKPLGVAGAPHRSESVTYDGCLTENSWHRHR
jgi:hypothetical protein